MKRKLSLLLAMILALTMVMGISVTAFADDNPYAGTTWKTDAVWTGGAVTYSVGETPEGLDFPTAHRKTLTSITNSDIIRLK